MIYRISMLTILAGCLLVFACSKKEDQASKQVPTFNQGSTSSVAGVRWQIPDRWQSQPPRQMRVATYSVAAASGDAEPGECAVFYFGQGQGGDVESNITRWVGQFEGADQPVRSSKTVDGLKVSMIQLSGTYKTSGGPMMASGEKKAGYRLMGAIVEAPEGVVFFKLTGPQATVMAAEAEFNAMIGSLAH